MMAQIDWDEPTNNRRAGDRPGRRASDYTTCHVHEDQCDRVKQLEARMVGWRVFNLVVGGLGAAIIFIGGLMWSINTKVDQLNTNIQSLAIELTKHTAASERK